MTDSVKPMATAGSDAAHDRRQSIRSCLTVTLITAVTLIYAAVALIDTRQEIIRINTEQDRDLELLIAVQADTMVHPLARGDRDLIEHQIDILSLNRNIAKASVLNRDRSVFAERIARSIDRQPKIAGHLDDQQHVHAHHHHDHHSGNEQDSLVEHKPTIWDKIFNVAHHDTHSLEHEIVNEMGDGIGWLVFVITHDRVVEAQERLIWSHLEKFLVIVSALALIIGVAVSRLVKPILMVTEAMGKIAAGDVSTIIPATDRQDEIGEMARSLAVFKANAEQLETNLSKERELNGLQRQFVAMVSHEFRTPLAVIDGSAQRILRRKDKMNPTQIEQGLNKVRHSVVKLTELMETVLDAARLEEGRVNFEPRLFGLKDLIGELCCSYDELNRDHEIIMETDGLPDQFNADPKLLRQIVSNLLSNAIKYSPKGTRIWVTGCFHAPGEITISVRDEGIGIPDEELKKLFQRFFRASTSTGIAGTGIGLHLVQHFVSLHRGRVEVTSSVNQGTTFAVHLPLTFPEDIADAA